MEKTKSERHQKATVILLIIILLALFILFKIKPGTVVSVGLSLRDPEYAYTQSVRDTSIEECEKLSLETQQQSCKETLERLAYLKEEKYSLYGEDYENILERYRNILGELSTQSRDWIYSGVEEEQEIESHPLVPEREPDYSTYGEGDTEIAENYTVYGE